MVRANLDPRLRTLGTRLLAGSVPLAAAGLVVASLNSTLTGLGGPDYWVFGSPERMNLVSLAMVLSGLLFSTGAVCRLNHGTWVAIGAGVAGMVAGVGLFVGLGLLFSTRQEVLGAVVVIYPIFPWSFLLLSWGLVTLLMAPLTILVLEGPSRHANLTVQPPS